MSILNIIAGPIIGSLIGYVTNYIAVKMLFRPLHPIKIGNFTVPFTPGIFPKRKESLAKALGKAVGNNLLTNEDIENMFLTEELKVKILSEVSKLLNADEEHTIRNMLSDHFTPDDYNHSKERFEHFLSEKIIAEITKLNLSAIIVTESTRAIKEKTEGTMLAMMVNDKLIASLAVPIGEKVESYINENGIDIIRPIVSRELATIENQTIGDLVKKIGIEEDHVLGMVEKIYTEFIRTKVAGFIKQFDIAGVVEQKVNKMDVLEIERLILSVMKRELNAIVNLGALIGLVIGLLNILV